MPAVRDSAREAVGGPSRPAAGASSRLRLRAAAASARMRVASSFSRASADLTMVTSKGTHAGKWRELVSYVREEADTCAARLAGAVASTSAVRQPSCRLRSTSSSRRPSWRTSSKRSPRGACVYDVTRAHNHLAHAFNQVHLLGAELALALGGASR